MRKLLVAIVLVVAAAGGFLVQRHLGEPATPLTEQSPAAGPSEALPNQPIAFTLPDLEGTPRSLTEWKGKARLVNFWATWCAPCRREIPLLKQTQTEHADDLQVIGVAVDFREDVSEYAKTANFNYPILVGQEDAMAAAEASGVDFVGLPFTMVVAPDGTLIKTHMGEIAGAHIETIVEVLQRLESGELTVAGAREALGSF